MTRHHSVKKVDRLVSFKDLLGECNSFEKKMTKRIGSEYDDSSPDNSKDVFRGYKLGLI
jgi:hypothetical protein